VVPVGHTRKVLTVTWSLISSSKHVGFTILFVPLDVGFSDVCFQQMVGAVDLSQPASLLCYLLKFTFVIQQVLIMLIFCIALPNIIIFRCYDLLILQLKVCCSCS
jgi:hypothetical protein